MSFNPKEHMIKMSGKDYLETKWRIVWFRDEQANGSIQTELLDYQDGFALVKATVLIDGVIVSTGIANADSRTKKSMWTGKEIMKAETAAIGRALAHAGYGTQFTDELEGDFLADGPVEKSHPPPSAKKVAKKQAKQDVAQGWSADTKMDFTTALSKRFPGVLNPQIFKGMGIKSFEELGTVSEAAAKVINWMYDNEKPFVADAVQYVMGDGSPFLVFRADDNPGSGHVAVRAYGRSSTVKNEWLGEYAYAALGFDTINKTPNKWLPLKYSLTVHYEQKTKDDDSVYYVATALGHNIYDPATVEAEGELAY